MIKNEVGTLQWALATGGVTTIKERARIFASGIGLLLGSLPARMRQGLGFRNPKAIAYDLDRLEMPETADAKRAAELCADTGSPLILSHSHRTYVWAMLLGMLGGHRPDVEVLYVASLLHDLTLTDKYRDIEPSIRCFAGKGAKAAAAWTSDWGWSKERSVAVGDAISLHLNTRVAPTLGVEAHLLHAGAALDVIGHGHWQIAPETMSAVLERYPRLGQKRNGMPMFRAVAHPGTRTQFLNRWMMFPTLVRCSQFDE